MLAVKAAYDNGTVRWLQKPPTSGSHNLIVVFEDANIENESDKNKKADDLMRVTHRKEAIEALQHMYESIPPGISLADELIAERRQEAQND